MQQESDNALIQYILQESKEPTELIIKHSWWLLMEYTQGTRR